MKYSYNTHDIYAIQTELTSWIGYRVLNIYDIDSKTICIKFNSNESEKKYLVIESGTKFYTLNNFSAIKNFPSSFCSKLRKHINNKRLEMIKQVNLDRVIDLMFGIDEFSFHIIGEFYASGNIIFTDYQYLILNLLHSYTYNINLNQKDEINISTTITEIKVCVGQKYSFEYATTNVELTVESVKKMFENNNLKKINNKIKLKQFLSKLPIIKYSSNVLEHSLKLIGVDITKKISSKTEFQEIFSSDEMIANFIKHIKEMFELKNFVGYKTSDNIYPFQYAQLNLDNSIIYPNFLSCASDFWSEHKPIETKEDINKKNKHNKLSKHEKAIWNIEQQIIKMDTFISETETQIDILTNNIDFFEQIIYYYANLENQTNYVNTEMVLNIEENKINYLFSAIDLEIKTVKINSVIPHEKTIKLDIGGILFEINYDKSVWENRENLYKQVKKTKNKKISATEIIKKQKKELEKFNYTQKENIEDKNTQHNIDITLSNLNGKKTILGQLKPNWFEQFNWFYTSDNILFILGKNAEQNELIFKKYMEPSDIYIHSEVFGSGSGILKNPNKLNISESYPTSLIEAGMFLISHTKAWISGVADCAYWVKPEQVSKRPETGEYLTKGSFMIRGHKNFIPIHKMELGFGILFKVSDFDLFKSSLTNEDQIEYAIPVVSTYSAILNYKYKVKIILGNQKIKKILPNIIGDFIKKSNLYEKEAIKKISNESIQKVLINKIKFVMCK